MHLTGGFARLTGRMHGTTPPERASEGGVVEQDAELVEGEVAQLARTQALQVDRADRGPGEAADGVADMPMGYRDTRR